MPDSPFLPAFMTGAQTPLLPQLQQAYQNDPRSALVKALLAQGQHSLETPTYNPGSTVAKAIQVAGPSIMQAMLGQQYQGYNADALKGIQSAVAGMNVPLPGGPTNANAAMISPGADQMSALAATLAGNPATAEQALTLASKSAEMNASSRLAVLQKLFEQGMTVQNGQVVPLPGYGQALGGIKGAEAGGTAAGTYRFDIGKALAGHGINYDLGTGRQTVNPTFAQAAGAISGAQENAAAPAKIAVARSTPLPIPGVGVEVPPVTLPGQISNPTPLAPAPIPAPPGPNSMPAPIPQAQPLSATMQAPVLPPSLSNVQTQKTPEGGMMYLSRTPEMEKIMGGLGDVAADRIKAASTASRMLTNVATLESAGDYFNPGASAPTRLAAQKGLIQMYESAGQKPPEWLDKTVGAGELIGAKGTSLATSMLKDIGGRLSPQIFEVMHAEQPNISLSGGGYKMIVGAAKQGYLRDQDAARAQEAWLTDPSHNGSTIGFETDFNKTNPPEMYASRVLPLKVPSNKADLKLNTIYHNGAENRLWNGSGFVRVQ